MQSSKLECRIHDVLAAADIPFSEEYSFPDLQGVSGKLLRFDFCIFDDNGDIDYLIEAQGEQHYHAVQRFGGERGLKRQQYNDDLKRRYCMQHNIRLVTIPYFDADKINYEYIMKKVGYM